MADRADKAGIHIYVYVAGVVNNEWQGITRWPYIGSIQDPTYI